jgi:hypothetical protein
MNHITSNEVGKNEFSCEIEMAQVKRENNASMVDVDPRKRPKKGMTFNNAMLRETDKNIRKTIFDLQKITGIKCEIPELKVHNQYKMDLIAGIPMYFKINLAYKPPPLKIEVKY